MNVYKVVLDTLFLNDVLLYILCNMTYWCTKASASIYAPYGIRKYISHIEDNSVFFLATSGGWSQWSSWSTCNRDCARHRRRTCTDPKSSNGGALCGGQNHDVDVCAGGLCTGTMDFFNSNIIIS